MALIDRINDLATRISSEVKINRTTGEYDFLIDGGGEMVWRRTDITGSGSGMTSGTLFFQHFQAKRTESITQLGSWCSIAGSGTLPTLCREGIYSENAAGDLTLIAAWDNDVNIWRSTANRHTKTLTSTFNKVRNNRYAVGRLVITTGTAPTFAGIPNNNANFAGAILSRGPKVTSLLANQSDLPSNVSATALASSARAWHSELLP